MQPSYMVVATDLLGARPGPHWVARHSALSAMLYVPQPHSLHALHVDSRFRGWYLCGGKRESGGGGWIPFQ